MTRETMDSLKTYIPNISSHISYTEGGETRSNVIEGKLVAVSDAVEA